MFNSRLLSCKKVCVLSFVLCLSSLPYFALAQSAFGLRLFTPQFSNFTNPVGVYKDPANAKYKQSSLVGVLLGASFRINLKNQHYLHTELLYSMRGESYKYKAYDLNGYPVTSISGSNSGLDYYLDYRTHYIEIPIMYCIDLTHSNDDSPVKVFVSSGFSTAFNVVSKLAQNSYSADAPGWGYSAISEHSTKATVSAANPVLVNFVSDIEFEFHRRLRKTKYFFYGRYNHSITDVFSRHYANMSTQLTTYGFGFGLRWYINE